eukprot:TRINITY_DN1563_c0_g1_i16.p1 TRINITY_DN1563_c0_g1~~TRINITY_DN1563_c0_g1_i16.p1  ORF type:complete len:617 (-),score=231.60 TRINITY_DN1563_c0_g1_i16:858-2708(-)
MKLFCLLAVLLALGLEVRGQDDAAAAAPDDAAAGAAGDTAAGDDGEECEESWEYIEFLRTVSDDTDEILEEIRDKKNDIDAQEKIQDLFRATMAKVLTVRGNINDRIFDIRKEEVNICIEQGIGQEDKLNQLRMEIMGILLKLVGNDSPTANELKEIGEELLKFRGLVNGEIMRVMMIDVQDRRPVIVEGCDECDVYKEIRDKIQGLIDCAKGEDGAGEDDAADDAAAPADDTAAAGEGGDAAAECMPPAMYFMDLMDINRMIDSQTESMFNQLFQSMEDSERTNIEANLNTLKAVRENIEETIQKLSRMEDDERIKRQVQSSLSGDVDTLTDLVEDCLKNCGQSGCEDSCGYQQLDKVRKLIQGIKDDFENGAGEFEETKEEARRQVMTYISETNKDMNGIIMRKVENDGMLEQCDKEKLDVFDQTKNPLWMVVNSTIFSEDQNPIVAVIDGLLPLVNESIEGYCQKDGPTTKPPEVENCNKDEYVKIADYVERVDQIIQENLFKPDDDGAKIQAQLGFLDVKKLFDKRIEELFNGDVKCPDELDKLKKEWMPSLNKCMAEFMNSNKQFSNMTRLERIQCTKELRVAMEARRAELLQKELEAIEAGGAGGAPEEA